MLASLMACNTSAEEKDQNRTTARTGTITVYADKTLQPLIVQFEEIFEHHNPEANINIVYTSEAEVIRALASCKAVMGIMSSSLTDEQKKNVSNNCGKAIAYHTLAARDAVAMILNRSNPDTTFTYEEVLGIIRGTTPTWPTLRPASKLGKMAVVFDEQGSSTVNTMTRLAGVETLPPYTYAVKSNEETIQYVAENPGSVGFIGWSFIADYDDKHARALKQQIRLAALSPRDTLQGKEFFPATQDFIGPEMYPLFRDLTLINCEAYPGLATAFNYYIAGEQGQRIILHSGLVPAYAPGRAVNIVTDGADVKVVD